MKTTTLVFCTAIITIFFIYASYMVGYTKGENKGFVIACDTMMGIMEKQIHSDTTVSEVVFESDKDTLTYYLESKKILNP